MFTRQTLAAVVVVTIVTLAGCAGGANPGSPSPSNATATTVPAASTTTASTPPTTTTVSTPTTTVSIPSHADVRFDDQASNGTTLVVARATLHDGGFVAVVNGTAGAPGSAPILGTSAFLKPGVHTDIPVELDAPIDGNRTLTAVVFADASGDRIPDADGSDEVVEGPNGTAVADMANVTVPAVATTTAETNVTTHEPNGTTIDEPKDTTTPSMEPTDATTPHVPPNTTVENRTDRGDSTDSDGETEPCPR